MGTIKDSSQHDARKTPIGLTVIGWMAVLGTSGYLADAYNNKQNNTAPDGSEPTSISAPAPEGNTTENFNDKVLVKPADNASATEAHAGTEAPEDNTTKNFNDKVLMKPAGNTSATEAHADTEKPKTEQDTSPNASTTGAHAGTEADQNKDQTLPPPGGMA